MKIIIVGPAYPYRGGIADTNESFCRALSSLGHQGSIVTFTVQYPGFLFPGKTQYSTDAPPRELDIIRSINSVNPLTWYRTARSINNQKPDIVIFRYWLPFMAMSLGSVARRLSPAIKVLALCDNIIPHEKRTGDDFLTKYFINSFDGFVTMSSTVQSELSSFTSKPQICIPHPINDNLGELIPTSVAREKIGVDTEGRYLLFFGLIRKYKGLDLTLRALGHPEVKKLGVKLIIAGEWYDSPTEYDDLIAELGIRDMLIIRNEFIASEDIQHYFSASDLITQTYHTASQSGVTQIAFHFEKPILVTDVGGLSEVVAHRELGYVAQKDPDDIASCIIEYFTSADHKAMKSNIHKEKEKYSWSSFGERVVSMATEITK